MKTHIEVTSIKKNNKNTGKVSIPVGTFGFGEIEYGDYPDTPLAKTEIFFVRRPRHLLVTESYEEIKKMIEEAK